MSRQLTFAAALLSTACGVTQPTPPDYIVSYTVTGASPITCDSVKYENSLGTIVKVMNPALPWSYAYLAPTGTYLQAAAWMRATGSGQAAKLKATWTIAGVSTASDSSFGTTTAAGKFTLVVSRRQL